jgi:uncharacterized iron-regulated protein
MKQIFTLIISFFLFSICFSQSDAIDEIYDYLHENCKNPSDYVISKFKNYDFIFLGEHHRIKHDADFVASLIPKLYENGIINIAYEFGEFTNQHLIDSLLCLEKWDEQLVYKAASKGFAIT